MYEQDTKRSGEDAQVNNALPYAVSKDIIPGSHTTPLEKDAEGQILMGPASTDENGGGNIFANGGPELSNARFTVLMLCISTGLFISMMDTAIVATAIYTISSEFGDFSISSWAILSYTLAYVACAVMITRLSDIYGRKPVILTCFAIFTSMSLGCALSTTMVQLVVFRGIQGIGGSGLYSMSMVVFPEIAGISRMPLVSAFIGAVIAISGVAGPVLGGVFTSKASWRWCFWINGPCGVIPMAVLFFFWPKELKPGPAVKPRLRNLDYFGAFLMLVGSVLLIFVIDQAAAGVFAWSSAPAVVMFVVVGLGWLSLFVWEWYISQSPKYASLVPHLPFRLLRDRVLISAIGNVVLTGFVLMLITVNIPLRAALVNSLPAIQAGIRLLPLVAGSATGSMFAGAISRKADLTFSTLTAGSSLMLLGTALMSTLPNTPTTSPQQWGFEVIIGLGLGLNLASSTLLTVLQTKRQDHAIAQGIIAQLRVLGGSVGIAVATVVTSQQISMQVAPIVTPEQLAAFNVFPGNRLSWTLAQQSAAAQAYADGFNRNMIVCAGTAAACLLCTMATWHRPRPTAQQQQQQQIPDGHRIGEVEADKAVAREA